jgi:hypothetical protein
MRCRLLHPTGCIAWSEFGHHAAFHRVGAAEFRFCIHQLGNGLFEIWVGFSMQPDARHQIFDIRYHFGLWKAGVAITSRIISAGRCG